MKEVGPVQVECYHGMLHNKPAREPTSETATPSLDGCERCRTRTALQAWETSAVLTYN